jgi:molybdopterin molybdotransferase
MMPSLLTVKDAISLIHENVNSLNLENVALPEFAGRILRQSLIADRPLPPFNRVMMDGFAINSDAWSAGLRKYMVRGQQMAGQVGASVESMHECVEVATGAPLPTGTDTVLPIEWVSMIGDEVVITPPTGVLIESGLFVHRKGSDYAKGDELVASGSILNPGEVAIAATCGYKTLTVSRLPVVGILGTGEELVAVESTPTPFQIRESNVHALSAACVLEGLQPPVVNRVSDDRDRISEAVEMLVGASDLLIFTGGVSVGRKDYLPDVLASCGFETIFHGVRQTPGKPLWFGKISDGPIAFGLPGNPISAVVGFVRYVRLTLNLLQGIRPNSPITAELTEPFDFTPSFTRFLPVSIQENTSGVMGVQPRPPNNSGDLAALAGTDGFIELPEEEKSYPKGYLAAFFSWRHRGN